MLLLHLNQTDETAWAQRLRRHLHEYPIVRRGDSFNRDDVRYVLVWKPLSDAFDGLDNLKAVLSYGAGVDALLTHPHLPDAPIVRFVDPDLTARMGDYVVANVMMHLRNQSAYIVQQRARSWRDHFPPRAADVSVAIMGLGELGRHAAERLGAQGFQVRGWSRSPKNIEGVVTFAGDGELDAFLADTDILVNLLPLTADTRGILRRALFVKLRRDRLPQGPVVINAARGGHQVEADLAAALSDGTLGAASLDVFETEPLPGSSPLWALENCFITPHIAAVSHPESGARYFANLIRGHEADEPLRNVVDRARGY
ncbi:MAG: glyoxylate/hydroxypyruvate reductase A [Hyphomicrobiaceae bacterium]|nr:glyoxylate/hydroxypyruvate reductase A [Hyphomicrobiaceae bacterium]MCC0022688.1 glyoxylate/hydroxypyruvate reductase A [Hyphomicrobiaceae bacterium]